jgi:hypothetical protein
VFRALVIIHAVMRGKQILPPKCGQLIDVLPGHFLKHGELRIESLEKIPGLLVSPLVR